MKKRRTLILIIIAILIVALVIVTKQYYDKRYVGVDYYTMVPQDYNMTPETIYDMSGKQDLGKGMNYTLTAYDDQGKAKTVKFTVMEGGSGMPQPGTYLQVNASSEIVLKWNITDQSNIPEKALEKIKNN